MQKTLILNLFLTLAISVTPYLMQAQESNIDQQSNITVLVPTAEATTTEPELITTSEGLNFIGEVATSTVIFATEVATSTIATIEQNIAASGLQIIGETSIKMATTTITSEGLNFIGEVATSTVIFATEVATSTISAIATTTTATTATTTISMFPDIVSEGLAIISSDEVFKPIIFYDLNCFGLSNGNTFAADIAKKVICITDDSGDINSLNEDIKIMRFKNAATASSTSPHWFTIDRTAGIEKISTTTEQISTESGTSTVSFFENIKKVIIPNLKEIIKEGANLILPSEELKWVKSYETIGFDTPSRDLKPGQYAVSADGTRYYYRDMTSDPSTTQFSVTSVTPSVNGHVTIDISKYMKVNIIGTAHYNEFQDNGKKIYREKITEKEYKDLESPNAKQPKKTVIAMQNLLKTRQAYAAISFDAAAIDNCIVCSSITYSHTTAAGNDRILIVGVAAALCGGTAPTISSITYNNVALTPVTDQGVVFAVCAGVIDLRLAQYMLVAPSTGANNVVVTMSAMPDSLHSGSSTFKGVHQTVPVSNSNLVSGNSASASVTVTTSSTDMIVDYVCNGTSVTSAGAGQNSIGILNINGNTDCNNSGLSTQYGIDGGVMSWIVANDAWGISAVSLADAGNDNSSFWWNFIQKITPMVFAAENLTQNK